MLSFLVSNPSSLHTFVNQFLILFSPGYIMLLDTGGGELWRSPPSVTLTAYGRDIKITESE